MLRAAPASGRARTHGQPAYTSSAQLQNMTSGILPPHPLTHLPPAHTRTHTDMSNTLDTGGRLGGKAETFHGGGADVSGCSSAAFGSLRAPLLDARRTGTTHWYVACSLCSLTCPPGIPTRVPFERRAVGDPPRGIPHLSVCVR